MLQTDEYAELVGKFIDPPSGWRYGFPKQFYPVGYEGLRGWMVREGYPKTQVDFAMQYLRVWK